MNLCLDNLFSQTDNIERDWCDYWVEIENLRLFSAIFWITVGKLMLIKSH